MSIAHTGPRDASNKLSLGNKPAPAVTCQFSPAVEDLKTHLAQE